MQRMNIFLTLWENGAKLHVQCLFNVTKRGDIFLIHFAVANSEIHVGRPNASVYMIYGRP